MLRKCYLVIIINKLVSSRLAQALVHKLSLGETGPPFRGATIRALKDPITQPIAHLLPQLLEILAHLVSLVGIPRLSVKAV